METRLPPDAYARVFESHAEGAQILAELDATYCSKLFHAGGEDGRRRTDFALGAFAVVEFIKAKIQQAHDERNQPAEPGELEQ